MFKIFLPTAPFREPANVAGNARIIRNTFGAMLLWLFGILSAPGATYGTSAGWSWFAATITEPHLALLFGVVGIISLFLVNVKSQGARLLGAALIAGALSFLAVGIERGSDITALPGIVAVCAMLSIYSMTLPDGE